MIDCQLTPHQINSPAMAWSMYNFAWCKGYFDGQAYIDKFSRKTVDGLLRAIITHMTVADNAEKNEKPI